jgi:MFS transporter, DHA2 family, methylenomycin A resistance protein
VDRRRLTLLVVSVGQFLTVMSTSVVSVALPTIGQELGASTTAQEWIVDAYVLVFAALLVAGGVLSDRRGRKRMYVIGVAVFGFGSLLAGLAPSVGWLIAARVVQGLGPAIVLPGSLAIVSAIYRDPRERATAIGLWSASSGLALAVGPALGGALVDGFGWRAVFLVNVPICLGLIAGSLRYIPYIAPDPGEGFDWVGAVLTVVGMGGLAFAIIEAQTEGWGSPLILAVAAVAVAAFVAFVRWERRRRDPLVDVELFRLPAFTVANIVGLVIFFAFIGAIVYFSVFFQQVQGHSAVEAGLLVLPVGAASALIAPFAGRLVGRIGPRVPMVSGLVLCGVAMLGLLRLERTTGASGEWWNFALIGAGIALALPSTTVTVVGAVRHERAGMASAIHNAMRQLGQVLGVAVLGSLVYARPGPDGFVSGLHNAIWVAGLVLLAAAVLAAAFLPSGVPAASRAG